MQATNQNRLLMSLGVSPRLWTLGPSLVAALVAAPLLTLLGTLVALYAGAITAERYELGDAESYWEGVSDNVLPAFDEAPWQIYPPLVLLYRSVTFMAGTLAVAEICARARAYLQPRHVPAAITWAVVLSGLLTIFTDWFFSRIMVHYSYDVEVDLL